MGQSIITAERRRLAPHIERVNGLVLREGFRRIFNDAAGRYALGKIDGPEFTGIVSELIRDAAGTAAGQDREADRREPWASMPIEDSERLSRFQRVFLGAVAATCLITVAWVVCLVFGGFGTAETSAEPVLVTVSGTPSGASDLNRDTVRELIIEGARLSWQAYTECGEGPAECDQVLREINANPYGVHFFEDGSAVGPAGN